MKGAGRASGIARGLAENLGKRLLWVCPAGQQVTMVAVCAVDEVALVQHGHDADARRLLADIDVKVAGYLALVRGSDAGLLEPSDQQHFPECLKAAFAGQHGDHYWRSLP